MDQIVRQVAAAVHYPFTAKLLGQQGQPLVSVELDQYGNLLDIRLSTPSGSDAINTEALDVFRRIGSFHLNMPSGRYRCTIIFGFNLKHESERNRFALAKEDEASVKPLAFTLNREDRAALIDGVDNRWHRPADAPAAYRLILSLRIDNGTLRDAYLVQGSGNPELDTSLLDATRGVALPPGENRRLLPYSIQLCLARPDSACAPGESQRQFGSIIDITSYVSDSTTIGSSSGNSPRGRK